MNGWKIPLYKIFTDDEDVALVNKVIKRGSNWAIGPEIEEFENAIKKITGSNYCVAVNSGTSALHATLLAYGLGEGDEIIIPSFSFISTANSVLFVNATPVFVDIEEKHFGLDSEKIPQKINIKTKAIIPMDYAGQSCEIFEIKKIVHDNNLLLIEDAAEGLGASVKGKKVGTVSDSAIFSFTGNKVLTTGEGGAIITNSHEIYEKLKLIRSHGRLDEINYFENPSFPNYVGIGYNWRMSSITAALGIAQLNKIDKIIRLRQNNANFLSSRLSKHPEITVPTYDGNYEHIFQMYTIKLQDKIIRDSLQKFLLNKQIFCKVYFNPIHLTDFYRNKFGTIPGSLPMTERLSDVVLTLPLYPNMTSEERELLVTSIDEFFEFYKKCK